MNRLVLISHDDLCTLRGQTTCRTLTDGIVRRGVVNDGVCKPTGARAFDERPDPVEFHQARTSALASRDVSTTQAQDAGLCVSQTARLPKGWPCLIPSAGYLRIVRVDERVK